MLYLYFSELPFSFQTILKDDGTIIFLYKDVSIKLTAALLLDSGSKKQTYNPIYIPLHFLVNYYLIVVLFTRCHYLSIPYPVVIIQSKLAYRMPIMSTSKSQSVCILNLEYPA